MENSFIVIIFHIINALLCFSSNKQSFCEHKRLIKKKKSYRPQTFESTAFKGETTQTHSRKGHILYPGDWQNKPSQGEAFRNIKVAMACCHATMPCQIFSISNNTMLKLTNQNQVFQRAA